MLDIIGKLECEAFLCTILKYLGSDVEGPLLSQCFLIGGRGGRKWEWLRNGFNGFKKKSKVLAEQTRDTRLLLVVRDQSIIRLGLNISEESLVEHTIARLEPQLMEYLEIRNPNSRSQLLKMITKYEDRNRNWQDVEVFDPQNDRRGTNKSTYRNRPPENNVNQGFENRKDHEFKNHGGQNQFRNTGPRVDFIRGSKNTMNFDKKSLTIPDSQIEELPIDEGNLEIHLSKTKLKESQKRELKTLFNSFKGLFSDKPGLTHVLYHEIDTGDKPPVISRPFRYDRVKQEIIDYHVDKILREGTIIPIQSPYASPVVLCHKNNRLPPDIPEAYRFVIDYCKLNAI
ncbi:retrovirus-related Pol polyprotein from transposon 17.6 [Trichonephila clavipes]|nr:retrovirus-related Pol polyprotein from transposon 17.6 [Trichonephila clavipes]